MAWHRARGIGPPRSGDELRRHRVLPDPVDKAAVLCVRLARNHPLPDGKRRVAYLARLEFLAGNEIDWIPPSVDETVAMIENVAAGQVSERELAQWLRAGIE